MTQEQLGRAAFPVGHLDKDTVREHARRLNLHVTSKPDSQEICFVPDGDYAAFVERKAPDATRAGTIVDHDGRVVGTHAGVHRFTIGQRKGLGLSSAEPLYVLEIKPDSAQVVVGSRDALGRARLTASEVNWISGARHRIGCASQRRFATVTPQRRQGSKCPVYPAKAGHHRA